MPVTAAAAAAAVTELLCQMPLLLLIAAAAVAAAAAAAADLVASCGSVACHLPWRTRAAVWPPGVSCQREPSGSALYPVRFVTIQNIASKLPYLCRRPMVFIFALLMNLLSFSCSIGCSSAVIVTGHCLQRSVPRHSMPGSYNIITWPATDDNCYICRMTLLHCYLIMLMTHACRTYKGYEEVMVPAVQGLPPPAEGELVPIASLEPWAQSAFPGYKTLNRIQSRIFSTAYYRSVSVVHGTVT